MAGNIKGITIEFNGDTTKLDKALREVRNSTKDLDRELKDVNRALKFNPTSVDLWKQKQELLRQKISQTKDNLKQLKDAQAQLDAKGVDKNSQEYRELQREIITAESKLKTFNQQLREIGNANLKALSNQLKEIGDKMTQVGKTMTTRVTAPIVAGYTAAAKYASDYEENLNKIDVAFGDQSQAVKDWANTARTEFGLSKVQATEAASAFGALGKGIGLSEKDAAGMSTTLAGLSADLGSYFNTGVDESAKALEGIFTGESEALKKFGVVMTDTNLQQFAEDQGLVWKEMDQNEKTMLRYQYVLAKTKDAQGDYSRTSDGTANSIKTFRATIQDLATAIGTNLLPIITPIIQKVSEWINKFNELSPRTQKIITIIGLVAAAIGPVLIIIGTLISSIGAIVGAIGMVTAPMLGIVAIIAAVVAAGILLYKNWDKIKKKAKELWKNLKKSFDEIKDSITETWNRIKETITNTWNSIKTTVSNALKSIKSTVTSVFNAVKTTVASIWNAIKTAITTVINSIKATVTTVFNAIKTTVSTIWNAIKTATTTVWNAIKTFVTNGVNGIKNTVSTVFNAIKTKISSIWTSIKTSISNAVSSIRNTVSSVFNSVRSTVSSIWNGIKNTITSAITSAKTTVSNIVNTIKSTVSGAFNGISNSVRSAFNAVKDAITGPIQTAKDTVSGIINTIKGFFPLNLGKIFNLQLPHFRITSFGSFPWGVAGKGTPPEWTVDWYKTGGIFSSPTIAGIGEAGPEAVVPLDTLWKKLDNIAAASAGGGTVINVYARDGQSAKAIAQEVKAILIAETRRERLAWQ